MTRMRFPPAARWLGLALLGMLIAAAISIAASRVASQQIGLASEPISAGDALAPRAREGEAPAQPRPRSHSIAKHPNRSSTHTQQPEPAAPVVPPVAEPPPPEHADDSGGSTEGDGEKGGGGADD